MAAWRVKFDVKHPGGQGNGGPPSEGSFVMEVHPDWAPLAAGCECLPGRCHMPADMRLRRPTHPHQLPMDRRFKELIEDNYFDECRLYRYVPEFIVQWGIPADPAMWKKWGENKIQDEDEELKQQSNLQGTVSFATSGYHARGSQIFVNLDDNQLLDDDVPSCALAPPALPVTRRAPPRRAATQASCQPGAARRMRSFQPFAIVTEGLDVVKNAFKGYAPKGMGPEQLTIKEQGNKYLTEQFPKLSYIVKARKV